MQTQNNHVGLPPMIDQQFERYLEVNTQMKMGVKYNFVFKRNPNMVGEKLTIKEMIASCGCTNVFQDQEGNVSGDITLHNGYEAGAMIAKTITVNFTNGHRELLNIRGKVVI
jgi:hypothetical protein